MAAAEVQRNSLTEAQRSAVKARGNVLVVAGAGTGKTKTLVERCLDCLENDGALIDELLIVTFTEAAAAEMRGRLREAIQRKAQAVDEGKEFSGTNFWNEQLARFDLAHIGTLHGFCLKLVREHFYELGLDPHLAILEEGEAAQLANEILDEQFNGHYTGADAFSTAVQNLIQVHGGGRDESIRKLVLQLHHYSQARPDAGRWLTQQRETFSSAQPADWTKWLQESLHNWSNEWSPVLDVLKNDNIKAAELLGVVRGVGGLAGGPDWRAAAGDSLTQITAADGNWPARRKTVLRKPLAELFEEARFLESLLVNKGGKDPLSEDWDWIRGHMETLLRLAEEFVSMLSKRKHEDGAVDFHDLEQFALKILWDFSTNRPTVIAEAWRKKLKFVFVDEYQDINAAQDWIIQGLSREGAAANRFLVGDVKQSIYRFRLADPTIFRSYARTWRGNDGQTIPLLENFRSDKDILELANSIFRQVMREEIGGVAYGAEAELKPGSSRPEKEDRTPAAELLLRFKNTRGGGGDEGGDLVVADDTQREAQLVAGKLRQMVAEGRKIFDSASGGFRPVVWRDIAILLRSPRGRAEVFAREFERAGIPLAVARGGFYESAEILDLLSLLQLLDNPLQDIPCIAVLRSPIVGLSIDELAEIRLAARDKHFWTALNRSNEVGLQRQETKDKVARFLERFSRWRRLARLVSLSQCLEEILAETLYADWLRTQPGGDERAAKVAGFLDLTQQFDQFQRQGLYRFLKYIEAQQEAGAEPEVPAVTTENAVRLMSIHQSKGLEFPVVVLADLSKQFNEQDLRGEIIFDEEFGLCPKVKPPFAGGRYPSLPYWLAQRRQKRELRGEELRLLYVALTRARDHLILTGSVSEKNWEEKWRQPQPVTVQRIAAAKCFADWLALWFSGRISQEKSDAGGATVGEIEHLRWRLVPDQDTDSQPAAERPSEGKRTTLQNLKLVDETVIEQLRARLEWRYAFMAATERKAKSSVTALRREAEELAEEAEVMFPNAKLEPAKARKSGGDSNLSAAAIGAAHHKFLQHLDLSNVGDLAAEAERLLREGYVSAEERTALDIAALTKFWASPLGRKIAENREFVRRELPFTARFSPLELKAIVGTEAPPGLEDEFIIVQGVADLVVLRPDEIWLVDFKTDGVSASGLAEKVRIYSPQLKLYASALEKVFTRKVAVRSLHFLSAGRTVDV